jgi:hypothetical protein
MTRTEKITNKYSEREPKTTSTTIVTVASGANHFSEFSLFLNEILEFLKDWC